jgi:hypothetical protein
MEIQVEFVTPPEGAQEGERIFIEGASGDPISSAQVKKRKTWEKVAPHLRTNDNLLATYQVFRGERFFDVMRVVFINMNKLALFVDILGLTFTDFSWTMYSGIIERLSNLLKQLRARNQTKSHSPSFVVNHFQF